jgi:uracil-DNA glycosylase
MALERRRFRRDYPEATSVYTAIRRMMDKRTLLLDLAKRRQVTRWKEYGCIADYHRGAYECDEVSPYSKTARNVDARIFVMLQDWISHDKLQGPINQDAAQRGHLPNLRTNKTLQKLLREVFQLDLKDVYGTNLFPFIKPGRMSTKIPMIDLVWAAREFGLPQIRIVEPELVICLGLDTFNAIRTACGETQRHPLEHAIASPFAFATAKIWCQAHTAARGRNFARHAADWQRMTVELTQGSKLPVSSRPAPPFG